MVPHHHCIHWIKRFTCNAYFFFLQVTHFYNTIDRQMIPSQQSMMLDATLAFENIIKHPKAGAKTSSEVTGSDVTRH